MLYPLNRNERAGEAVATMAYSCKQTLHGCRGILVNNLKCVPTTMTCVTVERTASPAIRVLSSTPLVQKVSKVLGETLDKGTICNHH